MMRFLWLVASVSMAVSAATRALGETAPTPFSPGFEWFWWLAVVGWLLAAFAAVKPWFAPPTPENGDR